MDEKRNNRDSSFDEVQLLQIGRLVLLACQMLCEANSAGIEDLELLSLEPRVWPDSSLGLPQPAVTYTPVFTSGYVLRIRQGADTFVFHTSLQGPPICPDILKPQALDQNHPLIANAMLDLAEQLKVRFSDIAFDRSEIQFQPSVEDSVAGKSVSLSEEEGQLVVVLKCADRAYEFLGPVRGPLHLKS